MKAWRRRVQAAALLAFAGLHGPAAQARPSVPWTPSEAGRHAIELLADEAGLDLTTSQWPLPAAAVSQALDALPPQLPPALAAARAQVRAELRQAQGAQMDIDLATHAERLPGFGENSTPGPWARLRSGAYESAHVALQIGGRVEAKADADRAGSQFRLDQTAVATELLGWQLQAATHRRWWSPGWQNALALSNNAPALSTVGIQRASGSTSASPWLAWMGPWNAEAFISQSEDVTQPDNPFLVGMRLTLRPWPRVELGVTRMAQWGGSGRPHTVGSFIDMLIGRHTNAGGTAQQAEDPGNGLAGFDARLRCPTAWGCAVYAQLIGEDDAGNLPSKYLGTYGLEHWTADGTQRFFLEYAETTCGAPLHRGPEPYCAYRNYAYPQGYESAGRWIGASVGPDSTLVTLGWLDAAHHAGLRLHGGHVGSRLGTYSPAEPDPRYSGDLLGLDAHQELPIRWGTLTPHLSWLRIDAPGGRHSEFSAGLQWSLPLDQAWSAAARPGGWVGGAGTEGSGARHDWLIDLALVAGAASLDHTFDDYARHHGNKPAAKALRHVGDVLPIAAFGVAGADWLRGEHPGWQTPGFQAMEAGVGAALSAEAVKLVVDRARPLAEQGAASFGDTPRSDSSFPSVHAAVAWAVVTPYAETYHAPWLYGVAALTNTSRVLGRHHWLSDTVAGALLGHWIGERVMRLDAAHGAHGDDGPALWVGPREVFFRSAF